MCVGFMRRTQVGMLGKQKAHMAWTGMSPTAGRHKHAGSNGKGRSGWGGWVGGMLANEKNGGKAGAHGGRHGEKEGVW